MPTRTPVAAGLLALIACGTYSPPPPPKPDLQPLPEARSVPGGVTLQDLVSGTTARFQAVSPVNEKVVWVSGTHGTFAVSVDGGRSWRTGVVAGGDSLEFRDVQGVDDKTAYLLSSGNGTQSRIYKTQDGGQNWQIQFINRDSTAFYDCFAFWDPENGIAVSDNVSGTFPVLVTTDAGFTWRYLSDPKDPKASPLPAATKGEGGFAASGTCLITEGKTTAYFATGAGSEARILKTTDRGRTWSQVTTPMIQGTATTGHTSVAFASPTQGIAVGGDVADNDGTPENVIGSSDGGVHWTLAARPTFAGAVFGVVHVPGTPSSYVAVGPRGASLTLDQGKTWTALDTLSYWSVGFASRKAGWLVGPNGRIVKMSF